MAQTKRRQATVADTAGEAGDAGEAGTATPVSDEVDEEGFTVIHSYDEVPSFASEAAENRYWGNHSLSDALLDQMQPIPGYGEDGLPPPEAFRARRAQLAQQAAAAAGSRHIALRIDGDILQRLKAVAAQKHKRYQTLLKEFVVERLYEEEKRLGVVK